SILLALTILLPVNIVNFFITPYVMKNLWTAYWPSWFQLFFKITVWEIAMGVFGVFGAILPSIYYYALLKKKKM
ncbi:MAG: hypothetical protein GWN31_05235, partial [Candidatus Thorarchaeota archaeon]|nr:hypothetical protein [Candidatus Thorarchaeota archaeon]